MDNADTFGDTSIASYERSEPSMGEKFKTFHFIPSKNWYSIWVAARVGIRGGGRWWIAQTFISVNLQS